MSLGLQGTYAGVGDLVEARANGWDLAGRHGNRRGPINRETYRVTALREDGGLDVETLDGEPIALPASYVGDRLALAYASTVHSAQGSTVDTSHVVVTQRTGPAALFVGMSRGRASNTAEAGMRAQRHRLSAASTVAEFVLKRLRGARLGGTSATDLAGLPVEIAVAALGDPDASLPPTQQQSTASTSSPRTGSSKTTPSSTSSSPTSVRCAAPSIA
ncbi:hypothetical protein [Pseudonocardia xishanensis]|uniref:UvrD-like helicase family protein n=1 Tax=Pseudonocardia xishanensis TaxID=630995 RepID=A0ABP8RZG9_9PSEU